MKALPSNGSLSGYTNLKILIKILTVYKNFTLVSFGKSKSFQNNQKQIFSIILHHISIQTKSGFRIQMFLKATK